MTPPFLELTAPDPAALAKARRRPAPVPPARDDLEAWRARLRSAPNLRARRELVLAWLGLWGGRSDGYGRPVPPPELPDCPAAAALRSACAFYWRPE